MNGSYCDLVLQFCALQITCITNFRCYLTVILLCYRDIPRAVYISFAIVIIQYVLVNISYFLVLTPAQFLSSDAVAIVSNFCMTCLPFLSNFPIKMTDIEMGTKTSKNKLNIHSIKKTFVVLITCYTPRQTTSNS